jgi:hypothetical protein
MNQGSVDAFLEKKKERKRTMKDRTGRQKEDVFGTSKKSREENRQESWKK